MLLNLMRDFLIRSYWTLQHPWVPACADLQAVELSLEDLYPEQLLLLTRTAVLVGVHGAALTNQIWMRPHRGAVVESMAGSNYHYVKMAFELGHKHFRVDSITVWTLPRSHKL